MKESGFSRGARRWIASRSLRAKVTISLFLPLIAILSTIMVIQYNAQQKVMLENLAVVASQTGLTIQNSLVQAMLTHDQQEMQQILNSVGKSQSLRAVYLLDTTGQVVFAPGGVGVGTRLDNRDATCQPCHRLPPAQRPSSVVVSLPSGERIFRTMNPIRNLPECQTCHNPSQRLNGVLLTDFSMAPLETSLRNNLWQNFFWWAAAIVVSVVLVNLVLDRFVLRRLEELSLALKKLGLGQLTASLPENQTDEIGQVSQAFNDMARQIDARNVENYQLSEDLQRQTSERGELLNRLITIQEDERKRVARELHDEFGQALAGIALRTEAIKNLIPSDPAQAITVLEQTQALINVTTDQMYNMILALRPSVLDDLGLVAAFHAHAERIFRGTGITFELDSRRFTSRLPPEIELAVYRIFQEALSNVLRHAHARHVSITLSMEGDWFLGEVADDGVGFDPAAVRSQPENQRGLGLLGMQERAMQYHGQVEIISSKESGTKVEIRIPIKEARVG